MDIMRRLAEARPAELDGDGHPDEATSARELGRAFAQARQKAPRRRRGRVFLPAMGTGAAAVTAVALVVALGGGGAQPPRTPRLALSDKTALLAAADRVEQRPAGAYWYTDVVQASTFLTKAGYAISGAVQENFAVTTVRGKGSSTLEVRDLPPRPLTSADETAWRAAGSPSKFHVWAGDHYDDFFIRRTGAWTRLSSSTGRFAVGPVTVNRGPDRSMTVAQLQKLPSDRGQLAKMFFPPMKPLPPLTADNVYTTDWTRVRHMIMEIGLICAYPLPPKVRAGLMRALAAQPGIHNFGTVTDAFGRTGIAVGADDPDQRVWYKIAKNAKDPMDGSPVKPSKVGWAKAAYGTREQLIFDAKTGEYLGDETVLTRPGGPYAKQKPGFVLVSTMVHRSGWTNRKPSPPTRLPFR
jgi:hypothetical protein